MPFDPTGGVREVAKILTVISDRQRINTDNIANAHTPHYKAREASFAELLGILNGPFETRMSQKMGRSDADAFQSTGPVNLQRELIEMQRNNLFYSMATRRAATLFTLLKAASQVGR